MNRYFLKLTSLFIFSMLLISCSEDIPGTDDINYVGFEVTSSTVYLKPNTSKSVEYMLYGTKNANDITVLVDDSSSADASYYSVSDVMYGDANEMSVNVDFSNYDLDLIDGTGITLNLDNLNGFESTSLAINIVKDCPTLSLSFDDWAEEAAWVIEDSAGTVVASGGIEGGSFSGEYAGMSSATISLCELTSGSYMLTVYDQYGDGGTAYQMVANEGKDVLLTIGASDYTGSATADFDLN